MEKVARLGFAILILSVTTALAQAPGADQLCPCANPELTNTARQKALWCHAEFQRRCFRGDDLSNITAVCVEEARLACLKRAAAEKIRAQIRNQYVTSCMTA